MINTIPIWKKHLHTFSPLSMQLVTLNQSYVVVVTFIDLQLSLTWLKHNIDSATVQLSGSLISQKFWLTQYTYHNLWIGYMDVTQLISTSDIKYVGQGIITGWLWLVLYWTTWHKKLWQYVCHLSSQYNGWHRKCPEINDILLVDAEKTWNGKGNSGQ